MSKNRKSHNTRASTRRSAKPINWDQRDAELAKKGFVRLRLLAAELNCSRTTLSTYVRAHGREGRDYVIGRPRGTCELWTKRDFAQKYVTESTIDPYVDDGGTWWLPAVAAKEPRFKGASAGLIVRIINKKTRPTAYADLNVKLKKIRRPKRVLRNGKLCLDPRRALVHIRDDTMVEIKKRLDQPHDFCKTNGSVLKPTKLLAAETKFTKSFIKEHSRDKRRGSLWKSQRVSLGRGRRKIDCHDAHDIQEAEKQLFDSPPGTICGSTIDHGGTYHYVTSDHLRKWRKKGHPAVPEGIKLTPIPGLGLRTESNLIYPTGHTRDGYSIEQLDKIEKWERISHEKIIDEQRRVWTKIPDGSCLATTGDVFADIIVSRRNYAHSKKILDTARRKKPHPALGRLLASTILKYPASNARVASLVMRVRVYWTEDLLRMRDYRDLLREIKKLGACRDSAGNMLATWKLLGCAPNVMLRRRKSGEVMKKVSLFGGSEFMAPVPKEQVDILLQKIGIESINHLPLYPEPRTEPLPLPQILLAHNKPKKEGRPESHRSRYCYEERMKGRTWERIGNDNAMKESGACTYAKGFAKRHRLPWPPPNVGTLCETENGFHVKLLRG